MSDAPKVKGISDPLCKICGHRHRFRDPHIFGKAQPKAAVQARKPGPTLAEEALARAKAVVANPPATKRKNGRKRK